ncbi:entericidin A/B family lipoprotein [Thiothrix nivea]|uniref:Entericidin EcnAB n=1 Tax=Thiothrix nivea (strain ATCC 35100 / DSM 5205 / JP2) TaxID=870187 RepID=A0A656HLG2_THINJ|nr:entericidin A/B family lipoprotein [Thiothrix nivea]EIJ36150.1 Entericidin EcnAB [Thiothrix nivea DSM 5205]
MQKLLTVVSLLAVLLVAGCSTVEGIGKDLKSLGGSIEKEAGK